jgi:glycosyltransferase involved in cell wall biosynthesis
MKRPLRVLYIHHGTGIGGAAISLLTLVKNIDRSRFEPVVLFLHNSDATALFRSEGIEVLGPVNESDFSHTKIWWYRWYHAHHFARAFVSTIKVMRTGAHYWFDRIAPDIVHLNTSSLVAWGRVATLRNIPVVWHVREPLASGYFGLRKQFVTSCVARYSSRITPICRNDALPWKSLNKVQVIYNAVDPKKFIAAKQLQASAPTILFLGGLSYEKGTLEILRIFKKVLKVVPNARLLIAGYFNVGLSGRSGLYRALPSERYKRKVSRALKAVSKHVALLGPITDVPAVMARSSVVVFPARVGHFARPVIEAGFMKRAVVASNLAPLDELLVDGKTGYLVDIYDTDAWAQKISYLLRDAVVQEAMGKAHYELCTEKFGLERQIEVVHALYSDLAKTAQL